MRVLDLFCGLKGFSQPFKDRGHEVVTVDILPKFKPSVVADVRKLSSQSLPLAGEWDVVLASPPCEIFSRARAYQEWPPAPEKERDALGLVASTLRLVAELHPIWWVMENPTGRLRTWIGLPREKIYQCSFGNKFQKPTDLWGRWPGRIRRPCISHLRTRESPGGGPGEHVRNPALRAKLPYGLGEELCKRMEAAQPGGKSERT